MTENIKEPNLDTDDEATVIVKIAGIGDVIITMPSKKAKYYTKKMCAKFPFTQE